MAKCKKQPKSLSPEEKMDQLLVPQKDQEYPLPPNWCWIILGKLVSIKRGASPRPIKAYITENENGVNWIKIGDTDSGKYITHIKEKVTPEGAKKSVFVEKGTLLLSNSMSFGRPYILNVDGCIHDGWLAITPSKVFDKEYLYYSLLSSEWYFERVAVGTAVRNLNSDRVSKTPIPLPPLPEQQRIVDRIESLFAKLDEAKEKAQAVVDGFEDRKAAILHKAFTGELTAGWRQSRGIDLKSWATKRLSETSIRIIDGDRGKNYPKKHEFSPDGYCIFLSAKNVTKDGFIFDEYECISKEKDELLHNGRLERGDMVMTTRGTIGNVAIYDDSVPYDHLRINSGMVIYRGGNEFIKQYLIWLYQSKLITNQIDKLRTGTAQPQLPIKVMNALVLPIPSIDEQTVIVTTLDIIIKKEQQAKEAAEQVISQIDTMKKSILARAFRGELGTNDPADESAVELLKRTL